MKEWALKYLLKLFAEPVLVSLGDQTQKSAKNQFGCGTYGLSTQGTDGRKKTSVSFPKCLQDVSKWPMDRNKKVKEEGSKGRKKGRTAAIRIPAWSPTAVLADRYLA